MGKGAKAPHAQRRRSFVEASSTASNVEAKSEQQQRFRRYSSDSAPPPNSIDPPSAKRLDVQVQLQPQTQARRFSNDQECESAEAFRSHVHVDERTRADPPAEIPGTDEKRGVELDELSQVRPKNQVDGAGKGEPDPVAFGDSGSDRGPQRSHLTITPPDSENPLSPGIGCNSPSLTPLTRRMHHPLSSSLPAVSSAPAGSLSIELPLSSPNGRAILTPVDPFYNAAFSQVEPLPSRRLHTAWAPRTSAHGITGSVPPLSPHVGVNSQIRAKHKVKHWNPAESLTAMARALQAEARGLESSFVPLILEPKHGVHKPSVSNVDKLGQNAELGEAKPSFVLPVIRAPFAMSLDGLYRSSTPSGVLRLGAYTQRNRRNQNRK